MPVTVFTPQKEDFSKQITEAIDAKDRELWEINQKYRQYMLHHLGLTPEQMLPLAEARIAHDQPGSSDFGSCSYICPGIQSMFEIKATDAPHSIGFRDAASGEFAHQEALRAGKANALICLDVLMNDDFATIMKKEFIDAMKEADRWDEARES